MNLYYQSIGEGQPLIMIHGLFGSSDNWRSMAKYFSKFFRVITVDLRNHGRSPHSMTNTLEDMANDMAELCRSLSLQSVIVLGHSLGGKVAMAFAALEPDLVSQLLIVDISPRQYEATHTPLMDAMMAIDFTKHRTRKEVDEALSQSVSDISVRQFLMMNLSVTDDGTDWRINLPVLKAHYHEFMRAILIDSSLSIPTLVIYGEQSDYVLEQDRSQIRKIFSDVTFAAMPTGHWVHAERPQQFKQVVEEFLLDG